MERFQKHQAPNTKLQRSSKHQTPKRRQPWCLELLGSLVFGAWCFSAGSPNMSDPLPQPPPSALGEKPFAFDFFRAVRLLECQRPDLPRVGFSVLPSEDPIRFWQKPSLRFAPSTIDSVGAGAGESAPRMAVNFFGLFGPNAPLPPPITDEDPEPEAQYQYHRPTAFV